jgi:aminopeptidase N
MTRDAEMSTGDFLTLVLSGVPREGDVGVLAQLLRQVRSACELYAAPQHREGYLVRLGDAVLTLATSAEPASDRQLVFVRALAAVARTARQRQMVRGLLDGTIELPGLSVDTDLRWSLLQRLVVVGDADAAEIDAELARDATATGQRQAAYARAAVPTAAAKEAAWSVAVDRDVLPNAILSATVEGFVQTDQRELQRSFVTRYFEAIERCWEGRTNETAQTLVTGLYPTLLAEQATVAATDEYLRTHPDVPRGARRLVIEGRDGVVRALRCQQCDAAAVPPD